MRTILVLVAGTACGWITGTHSIAHQIVGLSFLLLIDNIGEKIVDAIRESAKAEKKEG
jgi:hypothetical protein